MFKIISWNKRKQSHKITEIEGFHIKICIILSSGWSLWKLLFSFFIKKDIFSAKILFFYIEIRIFFIFFIKNTFSTFP